MPINRAVRCDHNLIYEGVTNVECDNPSCKNFDPGMYEFRTCVRHKDIDGVCFVWGVLWDVLYNIAHAIDAFVLHQSILYKPGASVWVRPLDPNKTKAIVERQRDEGILDFSDAGTKWSAEDKRKIARYFSRAIELGKEKYHGSYCR